MIIVQLLGGIGNQMFQYALGRHLMIINNCQLKLDIDEYSRYPDREYSLDCFKTLQSFSTPRDSNFLKYGHNFSPLVMFSRYSDKILKRLWGKSVFQRSSYIEEKSYSFVSSILTCKDNAYLQGYWQSEKYFSAIRPVLLEEFCFIPEPSAENAKLLGHIRSSNAVSLHVRRGDYLADPCFSKVYACCNIDYYKNAVNLIKSRIVNPRFFIFSDEPDWAENNLKFGNSTIVRGNTGRRSYEDMRLMMNCRHNIIANSSFSWWGAWLNQNPDKIVIAPKAWFKTSQFANSDIAPPTWERI